MLDIETAIRNLDNLKFLSEKKPEGFYCSKFSREGIIIITNLRISFFFLENDNEFKFDHMIFSMISKVNFNITNDISYLDISYAYTMHKFKFIYKKDILNIKRLLELYIPDKVHIDFLEPGEQKPFIAPVNNQEPDNDDYDVPSWKATQLLKLKETRPLLFSEKPAFRIPFKRYLHTLISLSIVGTALYYAYPYLYSVKKKSSGAVSYGLYFIEFQRCESEIFLIGQALNADYKIRGSFPKDFSKFIRLTFKTRFSKDSSLDPWGKPYRLKVEEKTFKISSDGPDKKKNTGDDFIKEFMKEELTPE